MRRLCRWPYDVLQWLLKPRLFWLTATVLLAALVIALRPSATEFQIRITGVVLEWLGIGTVAWGVRKTRQFFGHPGLVDLFWAWIGQFPRWRRDVRIAAGAAHLRALGGKAQVHSWAVNNPKAPLEDQVRVLSTNLENLNKEFREFHNEMDKEFHKHGQSLKEEERARATEDAKLREKLEEAHTGGLHISVAGVVWLFVGVLLATISQEIARWVG